MMGEELRAAWHELHFSFDRVVVLCLLPKRCRFKVGGHVITDLPNLATPDFSLCNLLTGGELSLISLILILMAHSKAVKLVILSRVVSKALSQSPLRTKIQQSVI